MLQQVLGHNLSLRLLDYIELTKPRLSLLVVFTAFIGWLFTPNAMVDFTTFKAMLFISMLVGGAAALNCYLERDIDGKMERTKNRSLPAGRLSPQTALYFSLTLIISSLILLFWQINLLTCILGLIGAVTYISLYTPLKRYGHYAVYIGAIPGAIPPVMGQSAASDEINLMTIFLFAVLFLWQIPHFFAISMIYSEDYKNVGFQVFPSRFGTRKTIFSVSVYTLVLCALTTVPFLMGPIEVVPLFIASGINIIFLGVALGGFYFFNRKDSPLVWAKLYFRATIIYLPMIFVCLYSVMPNLL